ncbi:MAG: hypothetical protein ACR2K2_09995 [Mycobacteriales bacterium]
MPLPRPDIAGIDPDAADAFARSRILSLREPACSRPWAARLSVVHRHDVRARDAADVGWWDLAGGEQMHHDFATSADVATALLHAAGATPVLVVWARPGPPEVAHSDTEWWSALQHAAVVLEGAEGGDAPPLLVITRSGWRCLPDGTSRTWKRLRRHG